MPYLEDVLRLGEIHHEPFPSSKTTGIFLTRGMQLLGTFDDFQRFKRGTDDYKGWHRHHVFERQDWSRLNIETLAPRYEDQLCVLLPERLTSDVSTAFFAARRRRAQYCRRENFSRPMRMPMRSLATIAVAVSA